MKFEILDERKAEKKGYNAKIKVIGIGGAGGNAINNMINAKLRGVDFIVANTDCQDLERSLCPVKIQLGPSVTMGLGAGADPEIGKKSAEESLHQVRETLSRSDMVFIAAGMGGGTGTGASPVAARESKENGALTVAVVTKPFEFEGDRRMRRALSGIEALKREVDSLIVIPNERLKTLGETGVTFKDLFSKADEVLLQAVKGISDLIIRTGFINLDFADVKKVMSEMGTALMGMGRASGEKRAVEAAQKAINSPLLEDISIEGARGLLMNITGPSDMTLEEVDEASNYIKGSVNKDAEVFWGMVFDDTLDGEVQVTVIATGIDGEEEEARKVHPILRPVPSRRPRPPVVQMEEEEASNRVRDVKPEEVTQEWSVRRIDGQTVNLDVPTWERQKKGLDLPDISEKPVDKKPKRSWFDRFRVKESADMDFPTFLRAKAD